MAIINTSGSAGSSRPASQILTGTPLRVFATFLVFAGLLAVVLNVVSAQDAPSTPSASATPAATPSATMPRLELPLEEVNESDLGGTVTLYAFGDKTIVEFAASGAGGGHPASILEGTCADPSDSAGYDLEPVAATGESRTVIDVSLDDLLASDHIVQVAMSSEAPKDVIACATVTGTPALPGAATPAASPMASPSASPDATGVGGTTSNLDGTGGATDAATLTINLVDWSHTGVTGTAVLTDAGASTSVVITLSGAEVTGGHTVHIHNGTCATPGSATYTLSPIGADGASVSTVNLSLDQLTSNPYFINIHPDEENWDNWMVCGNITGTPTALTAVTPTPSTGSLVNQSGDGSQGGDTTLVTTSSQASTLPDTVGVGDGLRWPSDTRTAVIWAVAATGLSLLVAGIVIRQAEKSGRPPRFTRLGL